MLTPTLLFSRQATLEVIKTHPNNDAVLENACWTWGNLSFNADKNKVAIVEGGGIAVSVPILAITITEYEPLHDSYPKLYINIVYIITVTRAITLIKSIPLNIGPHDATEKSTPTPTSITILNTDLTLTIL